MGTELGMKQKILSKENQDEIIRLDELRESLGARAGENERTISCLKEDIKELETSKEDFYKQLLEQRDETGELTVKLKTEIDSGNKLKKLLKENQDEITRLNESGIMSKVIEEEKERTISFLKEDIKGLETSKEGFGKQVLLQRHETTELSVKLKMEIDSGNELKILSKERQDEITRLNESRELSEIMAKEKERKISCLKVNIKELETSKEVFNKQLLQQRDETTELSVKLKTQIDSGNKLKILSKVNQDEITRLNELKEISEAMIVTEKNKFICSTQTISCLKEDIKSITTLKESFEKQLLQQRDETTDLIVKFKAVIKSGNKQKMLSKENQDEITRLNESRDLLKDNKEEKERMISCLKEDIKELETSKESFGKQLLQQRKLTMVLNVQLKTEIDSRKKVTFLSKARQDEIARLNESRELSETMIEEKERIISCLIEDIKDFETSKEGFEKQLLLQRNETTELSVKLKMEIDSGNKLKILSKMNQDEITRLNESREL